MKLLEDIFDNLRKHFTGTGKLSFLEPLFEATETAFFIPALITKNGPHIRDSLDLKRFMSVVLVALVPVVCWGIFNTGYQALAAAGATPTIADAFLWGLRVVLPLIVVSYGVGFFWEVLFARIRGHHISEGFLVTGLLFPLTLPPTVPLWQVAVGISFGVVIGKEIFGGTGRNILNPALTGRAFLFFAYPAQMSGDQVWVAVVNTVKPAADAVSGATPLAIAALAETGESIQATLTNAGVGMSDLFFGTYSGSVGATSAFCCLIGAVVLIVTGIASYRIIIGGVIGALATGLVLNLAATDASSAWSHLNPLYHLVMGGFAFGVTFMATDPVSAPGMNKSRWIYGVMIGALTVLIRVFNPAFPEGIMLAILFMNLFSPLLDHIEIRGRLKKRIPNV
jgi:Na+-transporting NADH:ubiquinone oxidoreductase subunit B